MDRIDAFNSSEEVSDHRARAAVADLPADDASPFLLGGGGAEPVTQMTTAGPIVRLSRPDAVAGRLLDITVAGGLLLLVLPLMAVCALAVLLSGPGPLLFRQQRVGRGGNGFTCLKFRTMVTDADAVMKTLLESNGQAHAQWLAVQKLDRDPRVTRVGRFLRRYCLDELPQLFNVLAGDMSVVGPRPIVEAEVNRYGPRFPDYCSVKPGITGLWQISGKHALSYEERVRLDAEYARSKSTAMDLVILWRTVPIVLLGQNQ